MERKLLDAVLLEFDGVLVDTGAPRRAALRSVLHDASIDLSDDEYEECCAGHASADAVRAAARLRARAMDETALDLLALRVDRIMSQHVGEGVTLAEGARETVERLASRVRVGIVARASRRDMEFVLSLARLDHVFACVVGAEDAYPPKPAPAPYLAALRRLETRRPVPHGGVIVALEDNVSGIRAAHSAGLRCIAVGAVPAHLAMEADALLPGIAGVDVESIEQLIVRAGEQFR